MYFNIFKDFVKVSNIANAINISNFCEVSLIEGMRDWTTFEEDMEHFDKTGSYPSSHPF